MFLYKVHNTKVNYVSHNHFNKRNLICVMDPFPKREREITEFLILISC